MGFIGGLLVYWSFGSPERAESAVSSRTCPMMHAVVLMDSAWLDVEPSRRKKTYHQANLEEMKHVKRAGELEDVADVSIVFEWLAVDTRRDLERLLSQLAGLLAINPDAAEALTVEVIESAISTFDNLSMYAVLVRGDDVS